MVRDASFRIAGPAGIPPTLLHVGSAVLSPESAELRAEGLVFEMHAAANVRVEARVPAVVVDAEPRSFDAGGVAHIRAVVVEGGEVAVVQVINNVSDWQHRPSRAPRVTPAVLSALPPARLDSVRLVGATFTYTDEIDGRVASVRFAQINASLSALGTRPGLAPPSTEVVVTGTVAGSGAVRLEVRSELLAPRNDVAIDLILLNQDMHAFESYTVPAEGMHLRGTIDETHAILRLDDGQAVRGTVSGRYRDLQLVYVASPRSRLEVALLNFGVAAQIAGSNVDLPPERRTAPLNATREPYEPLMGFLWRSLSTGAVALVHNGGSGS